jgi:predicted NAD-dependent protein-ADP-ribosyltransferase YbiA (DUF1768 family)
MAASMASRPHGPSSPKESDAPSQFHCDWHKLSKKLNDLRSALFESTPTRRILVVQQYVTACGRAATLSAQAWETKREIFKQTNREQRNKALRAYRALDECRNEAERVRSDRFKEAVALAPACAKAFSRIYDLDLDAIDAIDMLETVSNELCKTRHDIETLRRSKEEAEKAVGAAKDRVVQTKKAIAAEASKEDSTTESIEACCEAHRQAIEALRQAEENHAMEYQGSEADQELMDSMTERCTQATARVQTAKQAVVDARRVAVQELLALLKDEVIKTTDAGDGPDPDGQVGQDPVGQDDPMTTPEATPKAAPRSVPLAKTLEGVQLEEHVRRALEPHCKGLPGTLKDVDFLLSRWKSPLFHATMLQTLSEEGMHHVPFFNLSFSAFNLILAQRRNFYFREEKEDLMARVDKITGMLMGATAGLLAVGNPQAFVEVAQETSSLMVAEHAADARLPFKDKVVLARDCIQHFVETNPSIGNLMFGSLDSLRSVAPKPGPTPGPKPGPKPALRSPPTPASKPARKSPLKPAIKPTGKVFRENVDLQFFSRSKDPDAKYLSNMVECTVHFEGERFRCIEHAFQAAKYLCTEPKEEVDDIHAWRAQRIAFVAGMNFKKMDTIKGKAVYEPSHVRAVGTQTTFKKNGFKLDNEAWNSMSEWIMEELVKERACNDPYFVKIIRTVTGRGGILYHFDRVGIRSRWGGCFDGQTGKWRGQNLMGRILMGIPTSSEFQAAETLALLAHSSDDSEGLTGTEDAKDSEDPEDPEDSMDTELDDSTESDDDEEWVP